MKYIITAFAIASLSGCNLTGETIEYHKSAGLAKVSNAERTFVVDFGGEKPIRRCLEAPGPAALLNNSDFGTTIKVGNDKVKSGELSLTSKNTESMAKIYEVSSILQYTHAMSYRLCEAVINRFLAKEEYISKLEELMSSTEILLRIQLAKAEVEKQKVEAEVQLEKVKKGL
ncbi:hypothetical protein [Pseudoalteromonas rubra]|uniref:hypothetical protein n=1 Tax=Pseudoalteromonas rubra TaxID=43658 RepID=UPI002DBD3942|nr:hypothetical protein [Pseudoalteromonas rubra]MEC4091841.1 hypothetical protein [Pseudoalteromonas rubra]